MAEKKIGIKLAVDGEDKYIQAITKANAANTRLKAEMSALKESVKGQANTYDALNQKLNKLKEQQAAYSTTLKAAKAGQDNAAQAVTKWNKAIADTEPLLSKAEAELDRMKSSTKTTTREMQTQQQVVDMYANKLNTAKTALTQAETAQEKWGTRVARAEKNLSQCDKEIDATSKYLDEARKATDKCATSIDEMGRKSKKTGEDVKTFGQDAGNALQTAVGVAAGELAAQGVQKLAEAAKEAAKYSVEVGSAFEKSMSKVEALSGAAGDDLDKLSAKAQELGRTTQYSASEVADAMANMALAGWNTEQMLGGIDGVLQLAASSGMDLAAASDAVAGYLAAFNLEAEDATKLADLMATAQAKSKTTADQLAEAYSTSATNMTQAGQAAETTTALLEGMASVNDTGSAAGTKLSAVMAQITQKMKDSAIQIGRASVAVQDENGNFRDMIDIVEDVEKATAGLGDAEKAAALQKTFNRQSTAGMNELLAVGSEQLRKYRDDLDNSAGAAANMAATMNDNLKGDLAAFGSATEGLGIRVFDYIDGPARAIVQGATDAINAITDALTPQEDALREFIGGIEESNKKIDDMISRGDETLSVSDESMARLDAYQKILMDSAGATENDAYQKHLLQKVIDELGDDIPELTEAWDAQNGVLRISDERLKTLLDDYRGTAQAKAWYDAITQYEDAHAEAVMQDYMAQSALTEANKELKKAQDAYNDSKGTGIKAEWEAMQQQKQATENQQAATRAADEANKAKKEAGEKLAKVREEYDKYQKSMEETAKGQEELGEKSKEFEETQKDAAATTQEVTDEQIKAYENLHQAIKNSIENSISMFNEFSGGQEVSADEVLNNLESQIVGIGEWADNLRYLAKKGGENFSQEFYDYLAQMGPESANLVQMLVDTLDSDKDKFDEICVAWADSLVLTNHSAEIVAGSTQVGQDAKKALTEELSSATDVSNREGMEAGKEYTHEWKAGVEENKDKMSEAAEAATQETIDAAAESAGGYEKAGAEAAQRYSDGYTSKSEAITNAVKVANTQAAEAGATQISGFTTLGRNMASGVASGVRQNSKVIQNAVKNALIAALNAGKDEIETHSPSEVFKREIGRQIPAGVALGISDNTGTVTAAAGKMSQSVLAASTAWIGEYRQQVKTLESTPISATLQKQLNSGFGVSQYDTEKDKDGKIVQVLKDSEQYMSEYLSAAKKHLSNYQILHDTSLEEERAYWEAVKANLKSGTQAWYDAQSTLKSINEKITEQVKKERAARLSDQETYIKHAQILNQSSTESELIYWQKSLDSYEEYSDEWYAVYDKINGLKKNLDQEREATLSAMTTQGQINTLRRENQEYAREIESGARTMLEKAVMQQKINENLTKLRELATRKENEDLAAWEKYINRKTILYGEDITDELAFWKSKIKGLDENGDAYLSVYQKIQALEEQIREKRNAYYQRLIDDGEKYIERQQLLYNMSARDQLTYWNNILGRLKWHSDEWFEVYAKTKDLRAEIANEQRESAQAQAQALNNRLAIQQRLLNRYKTYYQVSAKAEMDFWNRARQLYKEGTENRIEADSAYMQAAQAYYDELEQLAEDYKQKQQKIDDDLAAEAKKATDEYEQAVDDRRKAILSGMNLWDAYDTDGYTSDELLVNMQSQTDALKLYAREWEALLAKGLPEELLKEIEAMGTSATANIYSLNRMTEEDLSTWINLWKEKNEIAERQAKLDNKSMLDDARATIEDLTTEAQKAYREIVDEYNAGVKEISGSLPAELEAVLDQIANAGGKYTEKMVDAAVAKMKGVSIEADPAALIAKNAPTAADYAGLYSETRASDYLSELSGILSDSEFTQLVNDQKAVYAQLADVSERIVSEWQAGVEALNNLVGTTANGTTVQAQDTRQLELLSSILSALERIGRGTGGQIVLDSGALVGAIYPEISELAAEKAQQLLRTSR